MHAGLQRAATTRASSWQKSRKVLVDLGRHDSMPLTRCNSGGGPIAGESLSAGTELVTPNRALP
jgi:hypothetical protein